MIMHRDGVSAGYISKANSLVNCVLPNHPTVNDSSVIFRNQYFR